MAHSSTRRSACRTRRRTTPSATASTRTTCRSPARSPTSQHRTRATRCPSAPSSNACRLLARDHAAPESTLALAKAASLGRERVRPLAWCSRPRSSAALLEGCTAHGQRGLTQPAGPSPSPAEGAHVKRQRLILVATAAVLTAVALTLGGVLHDSSSASPAAAASVSAGVQAGPGDTPALVARLQATLRANPNDVPSLDSLGLAYQQRARETGDPTYYTKSDEALHRALALASRDLLATSGLGSLALSRHRFREALVLGRRANAISPTTARNYGVIGDALVELGRYHAPFKTFDTMAS